MSNLQDKLKDLGEHAKIVYKDTSCHFLFLVWDKEEIATLSSLKGNHTLKKVLGQMADSLEVEKEEKT